MLGFGWVEKIYNFIGFNSLEDTQILIRFFILLSLFNKLLS